MSEMIVATHPGTAEQTVAGILRSLDARLAPVLSYEEALRQPMDALILLGGSDVSPFFYGECGPASAAEASERDVIEWILVRRALQEECPIFGICRGHQMLSVACGGALWQDIRRDTGKPHERGSHELVKVIATLKQHLPTLQVNSLHHQAVKCLPYGFTAAAYAPDGTVESVWRPGILGVQWHPELLYSTDRRWISLFEWFLSGLK